MSNNSSALFPEWRPLVICPDQRLFTELSSLMGEATRRVQGSGSAGYPAEKAVLEAISQYTANICFLDVGTSQEAALPLMTMITNNAIPAVALHTSNDPDLILRCLRCGASEFLVHPITADQLRPALDRLGRRLEGSAGRSPKGEVYCVMPAKGNYGSTTVACNLALQMKTLRGHRVLLADLDPFMGSIHFLLKLKSNYSFVDVISDWSRMDEQLWNRLITPFQGVDVLLAPETPVTATLPAQDASAMVNFWRQLYGTSILDCPGPLSKWSLMIVKLCDYLLMVTTSELTAIHSTRRTLSYLEENGIERSKIKLVVNRYASDFGLSKDAIETALGMEVFHLLPNDYEGVQKAVLEGKRVQPTSKFGKSITALCERLGGPASGQKKAGLAAGLFRLLDKKPA